MITCPTPYVHFKESIWYSLSDRTSKPEVVGSNPTRGTTKLYLLIWRTQGSSQNQFWYNANMTNNVVEIDGSKITDFDSFHAVFKETMGFPDFYGNNMNAWIDCMSDIHEDTKMSKYLLPVEQPLNVIIRNTQEFSKNCPDVLAALVEDTAAINTDEFRLGNTAPIQIIFK